MDIALDLGTANSRLRTNNSGNAIDEPSVIAYNIENNEILSRSSSTSSCARSAPAAS